MDDDHSRIGAAAEGPRQIGIDLIVLVLMMVAFRFHIASPDSWYFLPPGVMKADIEVLANWGIFGFLLMTVISLIVTHVIIAFHRSDVGSVLDVNNEETDDKVNLSRPTRICNHSFRCGGKGGIRARFTRLGYSMLVFLGVVSILLTGIGAWVKSFSFKFLGLAGVALGDGSETHYSLISVANAVYHDDLASFVLWASFLCFTLAIPVAFLDDARQMCQMISSPNRCSSCLLTHNYRFRTANPSGRASILFTTTKTLCFLSLMSL